MILCTLYLCLIYILYFDNVHCKYQSTYSRNSRWDLSKFINFFNTICAEVKELKNQMTIAFLIITSNFPANANTSCYNMMSDDLNTVKIV